MRFGFTTNRIIQVSFLLDNELDTDYSFEYKVLQL